MNTNTIAATAASAQSDGATTTANGVTIAVGGAAPNKHALLRFDTSVIASTDTVMQANLTAKVSALGGAVAADNSLWASDFNGAISNATYGIAKTNSKVGYRVPLDGSTTPFLTGSTAIVGQVPSKLVPTRFVKTGVSALSDFEIRPKLPTTVAGDLITYNGAGAIAPGDKPTLTVISYSAADLVARNPFRWYAEGSESFFAAGRETTEGVAVKAYIILDADSIGLSQSVQNLAGSGISSNRIKPRKSAIGGTSAGGAVSFDLTPEKWNLLLTGFMKITNTVTNGDGTYTHTFKVAASNEVATFTCVTKKGAFRLVYPGCKIAKFTLTIGVGGIVKASVDIEGLNEWRYDYTSAGLLDEYVLGPTAAYDSVANGLWSYVHGNVAVGGQAGDLVQTFTLDMMNGCAPRKGLNRKRGPVSISAGSFSAGCNFTMNFENELVGRKFFGDDGTAFPFEPGFKILFDTIQMKLSRDDSLHVIQVDIPKAMYEQVGDPIQGEGDIMMNVQAIANYSESDAANIIWTYTTYQPASFFAASTDTITVAPPGIPIG